MTVSEQPIEKLFFFSKRDHEGTDFFEFYRCFTVGEQVLFSARAVRFGKPMPVYRNEKAVVEINNRKNYLVNGRTDIQGLETNRLIGSYSRLGRIYDDQNRKIGRWRDARKWSEELKVNLVDGLANALLGAGDVPGGASFSDTHILSQGKDMLSMLQREKLAFFPDPPKSMKRGRLAKLASKVVPGELGKSLGEVTPPYGWTLTIMSAKEDRDLLRYSALVHIEYLRWARTS